MLIRTVPLRSHIFEARSSWAKSRSRKALRFIILLTGYSILVQTFAIIIMPKDRHALDVPASHICSRLPRCTTSPVCMQYSRRWILLLLVFLLTRLNFQVSNISHWRVEGARIMDRSWLPRPPQPSTGAAPVLGDTRISLSLKDTRGQELWDQRSYVTTPAAGLTCEGFGRPGPPFRKSRRSLMRENLSLQP